MNDDEEKISERIGNIFDAIRRDKIKSIILNRILPNRKFPKGGYTIMTSNNILEGESIIPKNWLIEDKKEFHSLHFDFNPNESVTVMKDFTEQEREILKAIQEEFEKKRLEYFKEQRKLRGE